MYYTGFKTNYARQQCVHFYSPSGSSSETQITCDEAVVSSLYWASQVAPVVKNPPANAGDVRDVDSIPVSGRPPGGGHGNPLQYSCLDHPTDRQTVHGAAESWTYLERPSIHACISELVTPEGRC